MIEVDNVDVWGFEHAVRGMRNSMNSWDKSDSEWQSANFCDVQFVVGDGDLDLMNRLFKASLSGDNHAHRKFMRQIFVSMDITAPLYWWKQADQYRIGVTTNSCSTMHKISAKDFELDDFSHEHLEEDAMECLAFTVGWLNYYRTKYIETKDKKYWWQMIQLLPSSYNQRRTLTMNYEVAYTIIAQRTGHKLDEWNEFVDVLKSLPYMMEIISND